MRGSRLLRKIIGPAHVAAIGALVAALGCGSGQPQAASVAVPTVASSATPEPPRAPPVQQALPVRFVIDAEYDASRIFGMFRIDDPAGLESRAASMGIDVALARRVQRAESLAAVEAEIDGLVQSRHEQHGRELIRARNHFEQLWNEFGPAFTEVVVETTQHGWFHQHYECVVSAFHPGISDWHGNRVAVLYSHGTAQKRRILGHEIALSHVFQVVRTLFDEAQLSDRQVWALSEITAVLLLEDPRLQRFCGPSSSEYFRTSNYPQLAVVESKLRTLYRNRSSFAGYVAKAAPNLPMR